MQVPRRNQTSTATNDYTATTLATSCRVLSQQCYSLRYRSLDHVGDLHVSETPSAGTIRQWWWWRGASHFSFRLGIYLPPSKDQQVCCVWNRHFDKWRGCARVTTAPCRTMVTTSTQLLLRWMFVSPSCGCRNQYVILITSNKCITSQNSVPTITNEKVGIPKYSESQRLTVL